MRARCANPARIPAETTPALVEQPGIDGRRVKAEAGRHAVGQYAYGYTGAGKGRERDAAPREDEQQAVRRIVELRGQGASYRVIAASLDEEGLRPRRAASWSPMSVRNVAARSGCA